MIAPRKPVAPPDGLSPSVVMDALALMQVLATLKLPKGTVLVGTREGTEVHRKDGVSFLVRPIAPRVPE